MGTSAPKDKNTKMALTPVVQNTSECPCSVDTWKKNWLPECFQLV